MRQKAIGLLLLLALLAPGCSKNVRQDPDELDLRLARWQFGLGFANTVLTAADAWGARNDWPPGSEELQERLAKASAITHSALKVAKAGVKAFRENPSGENPGKLITDLLDAASELEPIVNEAIALFLNSNGEGKGPQ